MGPPSARLKSHTSHTPSSQSVSEAPCSLQAACRGSKKDGAAWAWHSGPCGHCGCWGRSCASGPHVKLGLASSWCESGSLRASWVSGRCPAVYLHRCAAAGQSKGDTVSSHQDLRPRTGGSVPGVYAFPTRNIQIQNTAWELDGPGVDPQLCHVPNSVKRDVSPHSHPFSLTAPQHKPRGLCLRTSSDPRHVRGAGQARGQAAPGAALN